MRASARAAAGRPGSRARLPEAPWYRPRVDAARLGLGVALLLVLPAGCTFKREGAQGDADIPVDASACLDTSASCASSTVLRECKVVGQLPVDTECGWDCSGDSGAHCGLLQPATAPLREMDLRPDAALQVRTATLLAGVTGEINSETGAITDLRAAMIGIDNGIAFEVRGVSGRNIGVFRLGGLTLEGTWRVTGDNAIAIASLGDVVLRGSLDLRSDCDDVKAGPGGYNGAPAASDASGPGGGRGGDVDNSDTSGGGGGGYGAAGGNGGRNRPGPAPAGGMPAGTDAIMMLAGGGGGGGGGGSGGAGGGGGGAIHIAANGKVSILAMGADSGINAGGCGGQGGDEAGGGGGAGGTILIEAPVVELDGTILAVNGGGGGGGNNVSAAGDGAPGGWGTGRAAGGMRGNNNDGVGSQGGAAGNRTGANGQDQGGPPGQTGHAGGGGGGVGRIRINTRVADGLVIRAATVSPTLEESGTTATKGLATVR